MVITSRSRNESIGGFVTWAVKVGPGRELRAGGSPELTPNNLPLTLLGAGLLWFGWFGFNAGSAVAVESPVAGTAAGLAFATTQAAAAAAGLTWMLVERLHARRTTSLGSPRACWPASSSSPLRRGTCHWRRRW